ncbi:hypothetical protein HYN59_03270 [Flavobacterium album]|uniref:Uncharacterized protein n=1 Tax=Flavobacterium album TaxID=2175091 RepID=A0A2S1QUV0_9FLAO|nr:hypothetical protein [Flavobacterium album]AWH84192.1 hypothetical protein HYN59_03270 [Flavobacterium album]
MKVFSLFAFLYLLSGAATAQIQTIDDCRIADHFSRNAVDPYILINNIHLSEPIDGEAEQIIHLGDYTIKWINTEEEEVKIKIGEDLFSLKGQKTLNDTEDTEKGEVDFANNWEQARLYNYNGRELIVISMIYHPCVGRGCGIKFILVYDLRTKTKNFFGCFRGTNAADLYNFGDGKLQYAGNTYHEGFDGPADDMTISYMKTLYEFNENGIFSQNKDRSGNPYFIKNISYLVKKQTTTEANWPYKM